MESVESFIERALYDPTSGFYEVGGRAGRRGGSFVTSPEVGPLFGAVVARALDTWWLDVGSPAEWRVVDAGAGPGTLGRAILRAEPICADALHLVLVERTATQRDRHPVGPSITSAAALPDSADVVLANELLDNLPFALLEATDDRWLPVAIADDGVTRPDSGGARIPVQAAAAAWVSDVHRRLRPGGRLVCFDYADTTAALAARPWTDWVRSFAAHEQIDAPFVDAGSRDITVVVAHDQLPPPTATSTQSRWLRHHGIEALVAEGRDYWHAHAAAPDVAALAMRSRPTEAEALLEPSGLGSFWVGEWVR